MALPRPPDLAAPGTRPRAQQALADALQSTPSVGQSVVLEAGRAPLSALRAVRPAFGATGALPSALFALHRALAPAARERLRAALSAPGPVPQDALAELWRWSTDDARAGSVRVDGGVVDRCALLSNLYAQDATALGRALGRGEDGVVALLRALAGEASAGGPVRAAIRAADARIAAAQAYCAQRGQLGRDRLTLALIAWSLPQQLTPEAMRAAFASADALADGRGLTDVESRLHLLRLAAEAHAVPGRKLLWQATAATFVAAAAEAEAVRRTTFFRAPSPSAMLSDYADGVLVLDGAQAACAAADCAALPWREDPANVRAQVILCAMQLEPKARRGALQLLGRAEVAEALAAGADVEPSVVASVPGAEAMPGAVPHQTNARLACLFAAYSLAAAPPEARQMVPPLAAEFARYAPSARTRQVLDGVMAAAQTPQRAGALRVLAVYAELYGLSHTRALDLFLLAVQRQDALGGAACVALVDATRHPARLSGRVGQPMAEALQAMLLASPLPEPRYLLRPLVAAYFAGTPAHDAPQKARAEARRSMRAMAALLRCGHSDAERGALCAVVDVACRGLSTPAAAVALGRRAGALDNRARFQFMRNCLAGRSFFGQGLAERLAAMDRAEAQAQARARGPRADAETLAADATADAADAPAAAPWAPDAPGRLPPEPADHDDDAWAKFERMVAEEEAGYALEAEALDRAVRVLGKAPAPARPLPHHPRAERKRRQRLLREVGGWDNAWVDEVLSLIHI